VRVIFLRDSLFPYSLLIFCYAEVFLLPSLTLTQSLTRTHTYTHTLTLTHSLSVVLDILCCASSSIIKSEVQQHKGTYVGSYGEDKRKEVGVTCWWWLRWLWWVLWIS
jgi:hypothetical protein